MPSGTLRHLNVAAVLAIHEEVLKAHGGSAGLRDAALLESAVAAPQASFGGSPLLKDPIEIGAAYLFYLRRSHPFVAGNKRTALAACLAFLEANDRFPDPGAPAAAIDDWEGLVLDLAASRLNREQTTKQLRKLLRVRRPSKLR